MITTKGGFTLIEILLAIFIGSLVITSVYGIFAAVSDARNRLSAEGERYHEGRILFDRLGSELSSLRFVPLGKRPVFKSGENNAGDVFIEFNSELVSPLLLQHGGLSRIRYEVQTDADSGILTLQRSEQVLLTNLAASTPRPFIEGLKSFTIRFFKNGTWRDDWTLKQPPEQVEVALEMVAGDKIIPFRSSFILPQGSP